MNIVLLSRFVLTVCRAFIDLDWDGGVQAACRWRKFSGITVMQFIFFKSWLVIVTWNRSFLG
jgi:hypothetical protein